MADKTTANMKFNAVRYITHRKKMLKEEMFLIYDRDKINKKIREVRKEMGSWDRFLIQ